MAPQGVASSNFFEHVGVPLDSGNWMLYFACLLLLARANACANSQTCWICERCQARGLTWQNLPQLDISETLVRRKFVMAQLETPCLQIVHQYSNRQVQRAGDILEARSCDNSTAFCSALQPLK